MKKTVLLAACLLVLQFAHAGNMIRWARVKFSPATKVTDQWDVNLNYDQEFLINLETLTTAKVDKTVNKVSFDNLEEACKYTVLFMTGDGAPDLSAKEIANMREYISRGGFVWGDDCVFEKDGDLFFKGFKELIEKKVFSGKNSGLTNLVCFS